MSITSEPFSEFPSRSNGEGDVAFSQTGSPTYATNVSFSPSSFKLGDQQQF